MHRDIPIVDVAPFDSINEDEHVEVLSIETTLASPFVSVL